MRLSAVTYVSICRLCDRSGFPICNQHHNPPSFSMTLSGRIFPPGPRIEASFLTTHEPSNHWLTGGSDKVFQWPWHSLLSFHCCRKVLPPVPGLQGYSHIFLFSMRESSLCNTIPHCLNESSEIIKRFIPVGDLQLITKISRGYSSILYPGIMRAHLREREAVVRNSMFHPWGFAGMVLYGHGKLPREAFSQREEKTQLSLGRVTATYSKLNESVSLWAYSR